MNFISFIIKFIKFKPIIKFEKFERHNYAHYVSREAIRSMNLLLQTSLVVRIVRSVRGVCVSVCLRTITFVRRSRGEMYIVTAGCVSVSLCLSVCVSVPRCIPTQLHGPGCELGERWRCHLVVHYWADLQSVHGFGCYDNIAPNAKCQRVLVLALSLFAYRSRVVVQVP